jgi:hypothetical protein
MGRKGRERHVRELDLLRYYQWEFLRRNSDYQREYENFVNKFGAWFNTRRFWCERENTRGPARFQLPATFILQLRQPFKINTRENTPTNGHSNYHRGIGS